jgi:hypothetical protein
MAVNRSRPQPRNRYMLVPQASEAPAAGPRVRRYSLARLGVTAQSALGEERLERVASLDRAAMTERAAGLKRA